MHIFRGGGKSYELIIMDDKQLFRKICNVRTAQLDSWTACLYAETEHKQTQVSEKVTTQQIYNR